MKKVILATMLVLVGAFGAMAQSTQTANEFNVGYNFLRQDIKVERPVIAFNENTDSHGFTAGYTRYLGGDPTKISGVGVTGEVAANFDGNEATLVTAMGGITLKARNFEYVQPYARALGGVAKQNVNRGNLTNFSDVSAVFDLGGGLNFNLGQRSRYKVQVGADYVNTGFMGERQHGVRLSTGLIF